MIKETLYQKLATYSTQYTELAGLLATNEVTQDLVQLRRLSKQYAKLKPIYEGFQEYQQLQRIMQENETWLKDSDPELQALAEEEKLLLMEKIKALIHQLQIMLIPEDPDDTRNVFLEIRAAAGGSEAAIFAGDLLRMYSRYADAQKWTTEVINEHPSEQGGYKEIIVRIEGSSIYSHLKFESGTHRVQRVPTTEAQGRVHTSTCTVAILPEVDAIDEIKLHPDDLRIDTFRASGAGGQHVQKTDSAIRIVHLPSKIKVECQDERSQHKNRERALSLLKARLLADTREKQQQEEAAARRTLVGSGKRSERIRTYNIPQGRLTDHRIPLTLYQLEAILEGNLSLIVEPLRHHYQMEQLKEQSII